MFLCAQQLNVCWFLISAVLDLITLKTWPGISFGVGVQTLNCQLDGLILTKHFSYASAFISVDGE